MTVWCVIFRKDLDGFVSAHTKDTIQEARAFKHGVHTVSSKHTVYIWPIEFEEAKKYEMNTEIKRAKRAISMEQSRRKKDKS